MDNKYLHYLIGVFCLFLVQSSKADRLLNITLLENCKGTSDLSEVSLRQIDYHIDPATGLCDTVHGEFAVKAGESGARILTMTLYRCPNPTTEQIGACEDNATEHVEVVDCKRLTSDDSGPWAMFAKAIADANCGRDVGVFSMDYSTLKLNHLMNYLDIHDTGFAQYRLRMVFIGEQNKQLRACLDMDFQLVNN